MTTTTNLAMEVRIQAPFEEALQRVTAALKEQGFGVLTRIDVKETLKAKLDVDFRDYVIFGACNPRLANRALSARPEIGLMLPCNVTLETTDDGVLVRIVDPRVMMGMGGFENDPEVVAIAEEAHALLTRVAESLR